MHALTVFRLFPAVVRGRRGWSRGIGNQSLILLIGPAARLVSQAARLIVAKHTVIH